MKKVVFGLIVVTLVLSGLWAAAQMAGGGGHMGEGGMMAREGHRYGMLAGYIGWWWAYGVIKAAIALFALWMLYRITRALERIAASKS
jgi:hypothetical protein